MEKLKLDKWESAFLWDGIAHQIEMVKEHIARFGEPKHITDGECVVLESLIDKIDKSFEFEKNEHWDWLKERIEKLPKLKLKV